MAGLFDAIIELSTQFFFEKDDQLARGRTVFCSTETKDIDAALPGDRFRRTTESCDGVGKAGPVHVDKKRPLLSEFAQRLDFITCVKGTELSRLGNADRARLLRMQLARPGNYFRCEIDVDLAICSTGKEELRPFGEKFRGATFVSLKVCMFMTNDAVV